MRYVFALLLFASALHADVKIPVKQQVPNRSPGICMWVSLETCGAFLGYKEFSGLGDWYHEQKRYSANQGDVKKQLDTWQISYRTGDSVEFIRKYTDSGVPVLIGFHKNSWYGDGTYGHAAIVVNVTIKRVFFLESNNVGHTYCYSIDDFRSQWDRQALAIEP